MIHIREYRPKNGRNSECSGGDLTSIASRSDNRIVSVGLEYRRLILIPDPEFRPKIGETP